MIRKAKKFFHEDIWSTPQREMVPVKARLMRYLKVVILSVRGFQEDQCRLHASALTLFTLLSLVPVVAMAFGIAKGFGFEDILEKQILEQLPEQEAMLQQVVGFAKSLLANTKGGVVAGIGVVVLFWTVIKVIGYIEESFNHIWKIDQSRPMVRKFSDYLSLMLIGPVLMILSSSATVFVSSQLNKIGQAGVMPLSNAISSVALFFVQLVPLGSLWLLFSFLYIFIPNTKVDFKSGVLTGLVIATIYYMVQWAYVSLQVGVASYNAIYGSFAALPLFLIWLQLSWYLVLFGAEFSYYHQMLAAYEYHPDSPYISHTLKKVVGLLISHLVIKQFCAGEKPLTVSAIAQKLGLPIRLADRLIKELMETGLFSEVQTEGNQDSAFQPARDPGTMTVACVLDALEKRGCDRLSMISSKEYGFFTDTLEVFRERISQSPENRLLKEV